MDQPRRRGPPLRLFATRVEEPRARRAGDLALLITGLISLTLLSLVAVPPAGLELGLINLVDALPSALDGTWRFLIGLLGMMAGLLAVAAVVRRRWRLLSDVILVALLTTAVGLVVGRLVQGSWDLVWSQPLEDTLRWSPWLRLTLPAAVILVSNPHLTRPIRVVGWWLAVLAAVSAVALHAATPTLALASLVIAVVAAASIHLVFGSSRGRPDLESVISDLTALGVEVRSLGAAERQPAGVFVLDAEDVDGRRIDVKVYGRDANDTQRLTTLWRTVWLRRPGAPVAPGRLEQVEHEAFLTLLAGQSGVLTQPVVTAGLAPNEDALLVLVESGRPIGEEWTASTARGMWIMLAKLHTARISHGQIDDEHLIVDDDRVGLIDFRGARVSPDPLHRHIDQAQALVTGVLRLGTGTALDVALEALGPEVMAEMLPFVQADPLTPYQRRGLKEAGLDIDDVREEAAQRLGVDPPELERLRRVTWGSAFRVVLPILAFLALANVFTGLNLQDLAAALADASWWFVVAGLVLAQVPRLFQAVSALGASPIPLPLGRLYLLQLAQQFIALTIPGGAARIAMNVRFFQRHGLPSGSAFTVGAVDSFAGFLSQLILLGLVLTFTSATLDLDLESETTAGMVRLLLVVVIVAVALLGAVLVIPRFRRPVFQHVRRLWTEAVSALRGLGSPRRLGMLLGGNLSNEILLAITLGAFTLALGEPVGLPELLVINITVSLFAGIVPIPGGIGVVESALIFGLARSGVPEEAAFAAALMYRFATFYLPPAWGFFAFRWLEKNKHL